MTRAQILRQVEDASEAGVRKTLTRLVEQGIVTEERIGSRYTYSANRDHLLWPGIETLLSARRLLAERIEETTMEWEIPPISVELFGSVAQGSSTGSSDIDLLIIRPELDEDQGDTWERQVGALLDRIVLWTGNSCDIVTLDPEEVAAAHAREDPVVTSRTSNIAGIPAREIDASGKWRAAARAAPVSSHLRRLMQSLDRTRVAQAELERVSRAVEDHFNLSEPTRTALRSATVIDPDTPRTLARVTREIARTVEP
jgi:predicted nucleotidyltransferase